jgi:hypothetical protein
MRSTFTVMLAALAFAACNALPPQWGGTRAAPEPVQKTQPLASEPVLYARDGTVVTSDGAGGGIPRRDVQSGEGTRTKLLELYERVVEERDRLSFALTAREAELAKTKELLDVESARALDLDARLVAAEAARAELVSQNLELAGRLTTAQIRRLEAEKQWLELSLATPAKTVAADVKGARREARLDVSNAPVVKPNAKSATEPGGQHP